MKYITLSRLPHTWLIDVDGTILEHNGHKNGGDKLLAGVEDFWASLPEDDVVILLSARTAEEEEPTLRFIREHGLRYNKAIFGLPIGERILFNDSKPKGLNTAIAYNVPRNAGLEYMAIVFTED